MDHPVEQVEVPVRSSSTAEGTSRPSQGCGCGCGASPSQDGAAAASYVYAIGLIEARFSNLSAEKEFSQVTSRSVNPGKTDRQTLHAVLSQPGNRYLARQICWVFTIQGLETYILHPRDPRDLDRLVEAIRPDPTPLDLDVIIGVRGPIAPPAMCNGLQLPIVVVDQIYSFDRNALLKALPRPDKTGKQFDAAAAEVLDRVLRVTDNAGSTREHRAFNYLAMRFPGLYHKTAEEFAKDFSLSAVEAHSSPVQGTRDIVEAVFSYTNRTTDFTEKFCVRVDVTEEFPFLVTKLAPCF